MIVLCKAESRHHPLPLGEGSKKKYWFFLTFCQKGGGGVSANPKNPYQKILRFFLTKGGGSHPIQKGFIRKTEIFWHNLPKKGGFIKKMGFFLTILPKRGGVSANPKNPYQKKLVFF